jgi:pimeloyl-ACP methyl ester carboxylesterase
MWAVRDAVEEQGAWPVVIYAPSFTAPAFENADLCEYLASQGYVVMASPDMGAHRRSMTMDLEGIDAQARDISFLIGFARTLPQANSSIAVAGYSWGGISNLFAAAKDERIKALVFLDGSARYFPKLVEDSKYVHPGEMSLPVIFFTQKDISLEAVVQLKRDVSRSVLNDMSHCDRIVVNMHGMSHGDFSSLFQRSPHVWNARPSDEYSAREVSESYGWVARYTRFSMPN